MESKESADYIIYIVNSSKLATGLLKEVVFLEMLQHYFPNDGRFHQNQFKKCYIYVWACTVITVRKVYSMHKF